MTLVETRVLEGFDAPTFPAEQWDKLLGSGATDVVFLTRQWQRAWWETLGRGDLLLIAAERDGQVVAVAPLYAHAGMVYLVGADDADSLDLLGEGGDAEVLAAILETARARVPGFLGFELEPVPETSPTTRALAAAADRLGLSCIDHWGESAVAPQLELRGRPAVGRAAVNKQSLRRHEARLRRGGPVEVVHLREGPAILPHLEAFFEQHVARWAATPTPSFFGWPRVRAFYRRLTELAGESGWLRFTRLDWNGQAVAFHFGFCYRGSYLWHKPSFAVELARRSPGEVLLRHLLLAALDEGVHSFEFGLGSEPFKLRFATGANHVRKWGLYPQ